MGWRINLFDNDSSHLNFDLDFLSLLYLRQFHNRIESRSIRFLATFHEIYLRLRKKSTLICCIDLVSCVGSLVCTLDFYRSAQGQKSWGNNQSGIDVLSSLLFLCVQVKKSKVRQSPQLTQQRPGVQETLPVGPEFHSPTLSLTDSETKPWGTLSWKWKYSPSSVSCEQWSESDALKKASIVSHAASIPSCYRSLSGIHQQSRFKALFPAFWSGASSRIRDERKPYLRVQPNRIFAVMLAHVFHFTGH